VDQQALDAAFERAEERARMAPILSAAGEPVPKSNNFVGEPYVAPNVLSFMEVPYQPLGGEIDADVAIVGMPFESVIVRDAFVAYDRHMAPPPDPDEPFSRSGAYDAPNALRLGSRVYTIRASGGFMPERGGLRIEEHLRIVDVGDASVTTGSSEEAWDAGADVIAGVVRSGATPVTLGGDHTTTGIVLEGIFRAKPDLRLGAIVLDSHHDLWRSPRVGPGSFWNRAFENGILDPSKLAQIGLRGVRNPLSFQTAADELGVTCFSMTDVEERGVKAVAEQALEQVSDGIDALYISLDVDVIDPAFCPGQKYPDAAGLTSREVVAALRALVAGGPALAGYDVVCFSPHYDFRHHGAMCVARSIVEVISGLAERRAADAGR
jgi:arginase family enzyme